MPVIIFFFKVEFLRRLYRSMVLMGLELLEYFIKSGFQNQFGLLLKDRRKKRFAGQDSERLKT